MTTRMNFIYNLQEVYSFEYMGPPEHWVPPIGSFIKFIDEFGDESNQWRVQAIETIYKKIRVGPEVNRDIEPQVNVHLRKLHPGEGGNKLEPSGY